MAKKPSIASALLAGVLFLAGCASAPPKAVAPADLTSFTLARPATLAPVALDAAIRELARYDVVVLGEFHAHPGNHIAQMALFRGLQADLSLEQFERDVQLVVNDYLAGKIGEAAFKRQGRTWANYDSSYRPLVEFAKANGRAVIAANAPQDIVRCVGAEGVDVLARLKPEWRAQTAAHVDVGPGAYRDKFLAFATGDAGHGGGTKEAPSPEALRAYAAQALRDDTMADAIAQHLAAHPGRKVVHLTGYFHAAGFLGTVERLKARNPKVRVAVVNPLIVEGEKLDDDDARSGTFLLLLRPLPDAYVADEKAPPTTGARPAARPACEGLLDVP